MQKVIIIGGTSGIGLEMARQYRQMGYAVGLSGRNQNALEAFQLEHPAGTVATACFDVQQEDRGTHFHQLIEQLGGMDIFVYCAGIGKPSRTLDRNLELSTFQTNATGFLDLTIQAFQYFAEQGQPGHIAGISSVASNRGMQAAPAYNASKAFMSNYLEGLWFKARKLGLPIQVTDIQPGFVATKMAQGNLFWLVPVPKAAQQIIAAIAAGRKKAYISRRWRLIAWLLRLMPSSLLSRMT